MTKHSTLIATAALVLAIGLPALAQTQEKPAPAPAATGVAGKWTMSIQTPQGATDAALEIKLDKEKVTGTLNGPQGPVAIEGEYTGGKLGFLITVDGGGGSFSIYFTGALKEDGTLAGSADLGEMGQMAWSAKRAK
jgi:hypothetical protein